MESEVIRLLKKHGTARHMLDKAPQHTVVDMPDCRSTSASQSRTRVAKEDVSSSARCASGGCPQSLADDDKHGGPRLRSKLACKGRRLYLTVIAAAVCAAFVYAFASVRDSQNQWPRTLPVAESGAGCDLMLLSTFCTTKMDWQHNVSTTPEFRRMKHLYRTAHERRVNVTVLYDELPQDILKHETDSFKFERVYFKPNDEDQGLNDARFSMFRDLVDRHPEWRSLFLVDLFDVRIGLNPCGQIADRKLYVGIETQQLSPNIWMERRYEQMGGKYLSWFHHVGPWPLMNAGVVGGRRDMVIQFLNEMIHVLNDPELEVRKAHQQVNVNMAALNYVVRVSMNLTENSEEGQPGIVHGPPVHSEFKGYETERADVWFIHK